MTAHASRQTHPIHPARNRWLYASIWLTKCAAFPGSRSVAYTVPVPSSQRRRRVPAFGTGFPRRVQRIGAILKNADL